MTTTYPALDLTLRAGDVLPADGQWVLALHDGDPRWPQRRWMAGRFNTEQLDREKYRRDLGLTMPGIVECWSRVVAWMPLPEPPEETT